MNSNNFPRIRFLGGAGTVTGSKCLLTYLDKNILIDCGLFQGLKELRLKNWDRFPIEPKSIDAVILTHAHIDHSGFIPRLVKEGFCGKVFCTAATLSLCKLLLPDTGHLQQEEAEYLGHHRLSKHHPPLPLFDKAEAENSLKYFVPKNFNEEFEVFPGLTACFLYAGHILGAAMALIQAGPRRIAFSGDIGRSQDPIFKSPHILPKIDYLIVESTYGNRQHEVTDPLLELEVLIKEAIEKKSVVMIPTFAVGRAQELLYFLSLLRKQGRIPWIPMYLNSPMATDATKIFCEHQSLHKLSPQECLELSNVVHYIQSVEESRALNEKKGPMLILSASGMATGGRILHHLKAFASDPKNMIIIAGYQALGTRGRSIQDGAKEVKIHRQFVSINAKVATLENLSAHADYTEIVSWLSKSEIHPAKVFVTHGEKDSASEMRRHLEETFGWKCETPSQDQEFILNN
ncbi:MAG TPA: MBL fold metallo-hydrolase [Pseudobdellovibrionaceae bacterium]|jgi:metallo-beta-lactamase family protein